MYRFAYFNFRISYSIFPMLEKHLGMWLLSVLVPLIAGMLAPFILSIFSLEFMCLLQAFMFCVSQISRHEEFWKKARHSERWGLQLLPQMSHKISTLILSPLLFVSANVSVHKITHTLTLRSIIFQIVAIWYYAYHKDDCDCQFYAAQSERDQIAYS